MSEKETNTNSSFFRDIVLHPITLFLCLIAIMLYPLYAGFGKQPPKVEARKTPSGNIVAKLKNDHIRGFRYLVSYDNYFHCQFIDLDANKWASNNDYCVCYEKVNRSISRSGFRFICATHYPPSIDDGKPLRAYPSDTNKLVMLEERYIKSIPSQTKRQIRNCLGRCRKLFR